MVLRTQGRSQLPAACCIAAEAVVHALFAAFIFCATVASSSPCINDRRPSMVCFMAEITAACATCPRAGHFCASTSRRVACNSVTRSPIAMRDVAAAEQQHRHRYSQDTLHPNPSFPQLLGIGSSDKHACDADRLNVVLVASNAVSHRGEPSIRPCGQEIWRRLSGARRQRQRLPLVVIPSQPES